MAYSSLQDLPPVESLVAAVAARRAGSFSAAAAQLGTTHAAISRRIAAAEAWCGHVLFDRGARGAVATAAGERIIGRLQVLLEELQSVADNRAPRSALPVVRVATTPSFARFWLLPRLGQLQGRPQDMHVAVLADLRLADLQAGEADAAIRYGRGGWGIGTEHALWNERLVPVLAESAPPHGSSARAVMAQPLLHPGDLRPWRRWAEAHGLALKPKGADRQLADYGMTLDAAAAGLGIALWNPGLHPLPDGLRALEQWSVPAELRYFLVLRARDASSPVATLAHRIRQCLRRPDYAS